MGKYVHDHVEIEFLHTLLILSRVHGTDPGIDPQSFQVLGKREGYPLPGGLLKEDLEGERLPCFLVDQLSVFEDPTPLVQELHGPAKVRPNASFTESGGGAVFFGEDLGRDFTPEGFEDFEFLRAG